MAAQAVVGGLTAGEGIAMIHQAALQQYLWWYLPRDDPENEVLRNPKYTGFQVWNRRARKKGHNRTNPPEAWMWSEEPTHPAIVSREKYDAVQSRARANERSRQGVPATVARPSAKHNYLSPLHEPPTDLRSPW